MPASLDLGIALDNSRKDQTYNTPALATIFLAAAAGRLDQRQRRARVVGVALRPVGRDHLLVGRGQRATPRRSSTSPRSAATSWRTIDLDDSIDATVVSGVLRRNGIVDTESYRKLGRNQLRIALFPAIEPDDVAALTACIDHVVDALDLIASPIGTDSGLDSAPKRPRSVGRGSTIHRQGGTMPTTAEVRAQLTGPGGAFEVVTEVVDGIEMTVYKDRLPYLRSVAEIAACEATTSRSSSTATRRIGFTEFFDLANARRRRCATSSGSATATASPCSRPTTPSGA